jgi:hypothetical protein
LVPSESTTGNSRRLGSITKTGSAHARRLLVEDLSDLLCEVGVTDTALGAGKGRLDHKAEDQSRW